MKLKKIAFRDLAAGSMLIAGAASAFPIYQVNPAGSDGPAGALTGNKFNGN